MYCAVLKCNVNACYSNCKECKLVDIWIDGIKIIQECCLCFMDRLHCPSLSLPFVSQIFTKQNPSPVFFVLRVESELTLTFTLKGHLVRNILCRYIRQKV